MLRTGCRASARTFFAVLSTFLATAIISSAQAVEVIPDFYRDPGIYANRSYVNQSFNEHIDPFTGGLEHHYVDLHIPGNGGFDLKVIRSYSSTAVDPNNLGGSDALAGLGWTVHFGRFLNKNASPCINGNTTSTMDNPVLELPDGSRQILAFTGGTAPRMLTTQRWRADCGTNGGLIVYSPEGMRYDMTQLVNVGTDLSPLYAWYTTRITDRNGNYATLTYPASSPQVSTVTTNDGRSLSFTYADTGLFSRRITSITGAGQTYTYNYTAVPGTTGRYFLTSVRRPDGLSWNYAYNASMGSGAGSYVMNRVTYPQGGYITYGYGWTQFDAVNPATRVSVITSKLMSTGGSWSFGYTPGGIGAYDTTTVTSPAGTTTYKHIGPNYATTGSVWMIGLLMSKSIGSLQTETYTWVKQKISSESHARPGPFSAKVDTGETNAALLSSRTIVRNGATYKTTFSGFDGYGNAATVTESGPNGGSRTTTRTFNINTTKWIVNQVKNESFTGSSITRSFDANGNLTALTRDGVTTTYGYDAQGNVTSALMPRSLSYTYSQYKRGVPQLESQPESVSISRVVSDAGNVTSETNGDGYTTTYGYDAMNRVTSVGMPAGNDVTISYGATYKTASRGTLTETTDYDGFGRVSSITLGGITTSYTVDALGRRTFESNPGTSQGKTYQYDLLDRLVRVTNEDKTYRTITFGAGSSTTTDERGKATTTTFRAYGDPDRQLVMSVTAPEAAANITLARNTVGRVTSATQAGFTRTFTYNANGFLATAVNPETGTTTYGRDAAGNMTSRKVGASGTTTFTYDGQNRLASILYPGQTVASITYAYNKRNKLLSVVAPAASRSYGYDANGNLISESLGVDGYTFSAGYTYNGNDQLTALTYPQSKAVVSYAPDVLGRPTQVSGYATSVTYWPSGQIYQIAYANGTVSSYGQNSRLWPASFGTWLAGGSYYLNSSYTYDGTGNLTAVSDAVDSAYNRTMGYDGLSRLTSITGPWGSGSLSYSGSGNLTGQTLGSFSLGYTYDTANRLTGVTGSLVASYGYDVYGDISNISGAAFTYDDTQNLRCAYCGNAAQRIDYAYDGNNQRVWVLKAGVKTYEMTGANGNLLMEFTPAQGQRVEYIYLGGKRIAQKVSP